jgi:hypothetical protein
MRGFLKSAISLVLCLAFWTELAHGFTDPLPQLLPPVEHYHPFIRFIGETLHWDLVGYFATLSSVPQVGDEGFRAPPYNRREHFGSWVRPVRGSCTNTRTVVLIRSTKNPEKITYTTSRRCTIATGEWDDPYTEQSFESARDIQIDHVVPLKHAWDNGAARWNYARRCHFANFLEYEKHLLVVHGEENMRKGDRSPEQYVPPSMNFRCEYLKIWLSIKAAWGLEVRLTEQAAVKQRLLEGNCKRDDLAIPAEELRRYIELADRPVEQCLTRGPADEDVSLTHSN